MGVKDYQEQNVWEATLERVRYAYDLFDHVAVSFSGGKDSTVVLQACLYVAKERNRLPLDVIHFDEEAIPYEVEHYLRRISQNPDISLRWYCIPLKHVNACSVKSDSWITWNPDEEHLWVREMPPEALTTLEGYDPTKEVLSIPELSSLCFPPDKYGSTAVAIGIRTDESLTRLNAVIQRTKENWIIKSKTGGGFGGVTTDYGNLHKIYPIYDWGFDDVWRATDMFGWDYCTAYDIMTMGGIMPNDQRIAPPFGTQPMHSLWVYHHFFPELWNKMVNRVPGARTAARYVGTEMFVKSKIEKPDGLTYKEFIAQMLDEYDDPNLRAEIAKRLKAEVALHYKKAGRDVPIPYEHHHPDTGMSWDLMCQIVSRKDNKSRLSYRFRCVSKKPEYKDVYDAQLRKYNEEIANGRFE